MNAAREWNDRQFCQQDPPPILNVFLARNGEEFNRINPRRGHRRKAKECYRNALYVASRKKLVYCEGLATMRGITMSHAWCVDRDGLVVDPTWTDPMNCNYFGVRMNTEFAWKWVSRLGYFGVLLDDVGPMLELYPGVKRAWAVAVPDGS